MDIYKNRKKGISTPLVIFLLLAVALIAGGIVYYWQEEKVKRMEEKPQVKPTSKRGAVQEVADKVLLALKNKDMESLADFIHPDKGVRFTPYSYVDTKKDLVFNKADIKTLMTDNEKKLWGAFDGTGDPIKMTFAEYYKKFVYDVDFLEAPQIVFNQEIQRGNSLLNLKEAYPGASNIEYHFDGFDKQYNGMDWRSLRLVFEQKDDKWYLVGIIHEQWTI